mmetsp:Transcript_151057/g.289443  ORF Transcript_151057/g.289443 Transcript_151057/m.289443 type:complete len:206 (+) Transcript_151057:346-963(+)
MSSLRRFSTSRRQRSRMALLQFCSQAVTILDSSLPLILYVAQLPLKVVGLGLPFSFLSRHVLQPAFILCLHGRHLLLHFLRFLFPLALDLLHPLLEGLLALSKSSLVSFHLLLHSPLSLVIQGRHDDHSRPHISDFQLTNFVPLGAFNVLLTQELLTIYLGIRDVLCVPFTQTLKLLPQHCILRLQPLLISQRSPTPESRGFCRL